jgi:SAM-dependent methyltransferase
MCPNCGSFERHRLLALAMESGALAVDGKDVLHFAPEPAVTALLAGRARTYTTADLDGRSTDLALDMRATGLAGESWDLIVALHVLEHIPEDDKAMEECRRLLRAGGTLVAMVPIVERWSATYEDPTVTAPSERVVHFGKNDHVRMYGRDFRERLRRAGFRVDEFTGTPAQCVRYGLLPGETVFFAVR